MNFIYTGTFNDNGNFDGYGVLENPAGKYKGDFKDGKKNGFGVFENKNAIKYEGEYKNDVKVGKGKIILKSGKIAYCGDFVNGLPEG